MKKQRAILTAAAAVLAMGGTACGLLEPDPWRVRQAELDVNRSVWEDAAITEYTYELNRLCYCGLAGTLTVTVADHAVVAVTREDGERIPPQDLHVVETVDDLFDVIQRAIDEKAFRYTVEYHAELGYPTLVDLDPIRNAIDEEVRYEAGGLEPITGG
jgi:hypothetical protein